MSAWDSKSAEKSGSGNFNPPDPGNLWTGETPPATFDWNSDNAGDVSEHDFPSMSNSDPSTSKAGGQFPKGGTNISYTNIFEGGGSEKRGGSGTNVSK